MSTIEMSTYRGEDFYPLPQTPAPPSKPEPSMLLEKIMIVSAAALAMVALSSLFFVFPGFPIIFAILVTVSSGSLGTFFIKTLTESPPPAPVVDTRWRLPGRFY